MKAKIRIPWEPGPARRAEKVRCSRFPLQAFLTLLLITLLAACVPEERVSRDHEPTPAQESVPEIHILVDAAEMLVTREGGGEDTFAIVLDNPPPGEITFSVRTSDPSEGTVQPAEITFGRDNWDVPQVVTVTGVDDEEEDGNQGYVIFLDPVVGGLSVEGAGPALELDVTNADDEAPGLTIRREVVAFSEAGGEGAFTVLMNTEPDGEVVVDVGCTDPSEALLATEEGEPGSEQRLVFTPEDWHLPRRVMLFGQDDDVIDGDQVLSLSVEVNAEESTDGTGYSSLETQWVEVIVQDDDVEGITVEILRGCAVRAA